MSHERVGRSRSGVVAAALLLCLSACSDGPLATTPSVRLVLTPEAEDLAAGDVVLVAVAAENEHGSPVSVGPVQLSTDEARVAVVDPSGRLRAVGAGTTLLRGEASGAVGELRVDVRPAPALFWLERFDGEPLPVLVAADSVDWNGEREYHEVHARSGALALTGGQSPGYELSVHYEEYDVRQVGELRQFTLRVAWDEYDRGSVAYDALGDLALTSELVAPLHHGATPVSGGFTVDFRIPGSDDRVDLFYRR